MVALQSNFDFFGDFLLPEGVFRHFWTLWSPDRIQVKLILLNKAKLRISEQFEVFLIGRCTFKDDFEYFNICQKCSFFEQ